MLLEAHNFNRWTAKNHDQLLFYVNLNPSKTSDCVVVIEDKFLSPHKIVGLHLPWWRPVLPHRPCNFSRGRKQKNWVKTAKLGTMDYWFVFERDNGFLIGWNYWFGGLEA